MVTKMLRIIYVVLKTSRPYYDRTADYDALMVKQRPTLDSHARPLRLHRARGRRPQGRLTGPHHASRP